MIYILGIDHLVQHNKSLVETISFIKYIEIFIINKQIEVVAEEFSEYAASLNKVQMSTTKEVSDRLKRIHLYCDPNHEERKKIGIRDDNQIKKDLGITTPYIASQDLSRFDLEKKKDFFKRETFWYKKIEKYLAKNILFICGNTHLETFPLILKEHSQSYEINEKRFV
jgi:hypothetical protein